MPVSIPPVAFVFLLPMVVALVLLCLVVVRRHPYAKRLQETNDIAGFYITLFGALYGVFLGFMVLVVWTRFDQAETLTEQEAVTAANLYVLAGNLPQGNTRGIRAGLERYVTVVIRDEWPLMNVGASHSEKAFRALIHLYRVVGRIKPTDTREEVMMDQMVALTNQMYEQRRLRLLANEKGIPLMFWGVLHIGAVVMIGSTVLFGVERFSFHALKTALLTLLVCVMLYAVHEVDYPFRGEVHVSSEPFVRTQHAFEEIRAQEAGGLLLDDD